MSNIFKLYPIHFSRGEKNFLGRFAQPAPPLVTGLDKISIEKNITYRKINIAKNIAILKNVLPKICHKLE